MKQALLLVALALAALQVAVGATYLVLSFFVGEIRGEGVVTEFRLSPEQTWIVAAGMAGACLAAVGLLQARRRPVEATAAVILGALPGIAYSMPPVVHPAVLLLPVGVLAVWMTQRSARRKATGV